MEEIVIDSSIIFDLYLALSERERCRFVTADERLANAIRAALPGVVWLADWP